ncbi:acyl-CoA-binding domain-containing protein 2 isoform X2 [Beta vulgaris subsp. vulgaris]|uniref:acyl-CoA-binding domain-containing protein 2 isoform X2 n=1 Tax=Beta vulgaris subsp. vulgaris TaxID=3555 RepID=UPI0025472551|nr:acyl-CoA-binding domain-containing protein 2 isoform X2 [Beta vulgaris subsp. vulgaris]
MMLNFSFMACIRLLLKVLVVPRLLPPSSSRLEPSGICYEKGSSDFFCGKLNLDTENESIRGRLLERSELVILMDSVSCHELSARSELVGSDCNQVATFWDSCGFRPHLCSTKNRNAWQKMGAMPPEDAMQKYVDIVTELFPTWASGGADKAKGGAQEHSSDSKGPMGPVFSSFIHEEESGVESKMDAVHAFAREGDIDSLVKCIENGVSVNLKDSEGRTPLHWAVDRGHLPVLELLCSKDADMNVKDNEGQTPLHYAVVCEREAIAEYLVKHNADVGIKDNDGVSPSDLCEKNWPWMRPTDKVVE